LAACKRKRLRFLQFSFTQRKRFRASVTCGLTAWRPASAPASTLVSSTGMSLLIYLLLSAVVYLAVEHDDDVDVSVV